MNAITNVTVANTNNTTTTENNTMNNTYSVDCKMIGEELLNVQQLSATTYVVRGTSCDNVRPFIHQVVGDYYNGDTTLNTHNGVDVLVTLVVDSNDLPWNEATIELPVAPCDMEYPDIDFTDYSGIDTAEEDALLVEVMNKFEEVANTPVKPNPMDKQTMKKSEQLTAESVVPQLFAEIMLRDMCSDFTIANKQVIAASMFKAMWNMVDTVVTPVDFDTQYYGAFNYVSARNRDAGELFEGVNPLEMLITMGFMEELGGVFYVSQKFYDACYVSEKTAPLTTMIDDTNRRVSQVKGGKVKPSKLLDKAMRFLEATPFSADMDMTTIINLVKSQTPELAIWKDVKGSMNGINDMEAGVDYYSEQKADKRGRMYHVAHAGTNPQGDDYNRSIYKLNVESIVNKSSEAYTYFMNELEEAAGKNPKYMATDYLMRVGKSPVRALKTFLESAGVDSPFMYVRLARYFVTFEENGMCDVRVPMGLDAKCSGTQILAILAGNKQLLEATGFTMKKVFDPYALCAIQMDMAGIDRNAMKTPYMAIQYGGGKTALIEQKDYMQVMFEAGVEDAETAANITIEAVKRVLGNKIIGLQEYMAEAVSAIMNETCATNVVYTHIDGQIVDLQVCGKVELTATFTSIRYTQNTIISFGSQLKNTGLTVSDKTPSAAEYARTFMVNYIQGIDALIARTVAALAKDAGIKGYVSIHDCFRTALKDTPKLKALICKAYEMIFVENDPIAHLCSQLNIDMPMVSRELTSDMIYNKEAYFFC